MKKEFIPWRLGSLVIDSQAEEERLVAVLANTTRLMDLIDPIKHARILVFKNKHHYLNKMKWRKRKEREDFTLPFPSDFRHPSSALDEL